MAGMATRTVKTVKTVKKGTRRMMMVLLLKPLEGKTFQRIRCQNRDFAVGNPLPLFERDQHALY